MSRLFYAGIRAHNRLSDVGEGGVVFSVDNGAKRSFLRFDSFDDFEPWYLELEPGMKTLSEVVMSDARKLVLDIDDPGGATSNVGHDGVTVLDMLLMYDFDRHVTSRIHDVFFALDIGKPDVVMYTMCSDDKMSYHAVVSNFAFSAQACSGLCAIISSGQPWECCVDTGVYKRVQSIRIEMSTKFGEARWKERLGNPGPLRQGLLSDLKGTTTSDFVASVSYSNQRMLQPVPQFFVVKILKGQFRMGRPRSNGTIPLYRIRPGMCSQCNRVHDRENAFLKPSLASPVFVCWRYYNSHKGTLRTDL